MNEINQWVESRNYIVPPLDGKLDEQESFPYCSGEATV
jgi:hypothetical protein